MSLRPGLYLSVQPWWVPSGYVSFWWGGQGSPGCSTVLLVFAFRPVLCEKQALRNKASFPIRVGLCFWREEREWGDHRAYWGDQGKKWQSVQGHVGRNRKGSLPSYWLKPVTVPWGQPHWVGNPVGLFNCGDVPSASADGVVGAQG